MVQVQEHDSRVLKDPGRKKYQFSRDYKQPNPCRESLPPEIDSRRSAQQYRQSVGEVHCTHKVSLFLTVESQVADTAVLLHTKRRGEDLPT